MLGTGQRLEDGLRRSEKVIYTANPELLRVPMVPLNISGLQQGTVAIFLQVSRTAVLSMMHDWNDA